MARRAVSANAPTNTNPDAVAACYAEYASLMADGARNSAKIAALFGRYERSDGVDKKGIKHAYAISSKDPAEVARQHARNSEYLGILGLIEVEASGQIRMGADVIPIRAKPSKEMQAQVAAARAFGDGYNSGLAGGQIDACKHPVGSEEFVRWRDGWTDGYADRIARKPEAAQQTEAQPRRPVGRPKGSGKKQQPEVTEPIEQTDLEEHIRESVQDDA